MFCLFLVKKLDYNEVAAKASVYNTTVYVGNLPDHIGGTYMKSPISDEGPVLETLDFAFFTEQKTLLK